MAEATATASSFYPRERKKLKQAEDLGPPVKDDESVGRERAIYGPPEHLGYALLAGYSQRPAPAPPLSYDIHTTSSSIFDDPIFYIPERQPLPPLEPEVSEMLNMTTLYNLLDLHLNKKTGRKVYRGDPLSDKAYLFLFYEFKGVDTNYQQVLADKDIIGMWWKPHNRLDFCDQMNSRFESMPKSVVLAKKIVDEKNLQLGSRDLLECLEDLCAIWEWEHKLLRYKKYEEFLLNFWTENLRKPKLEEIGAKFCTGNLGKPKFDEIGAKFLAGPTWVTVNRHKLCSTSACAYPEPGKSCVGLTPYWVEQLGKNLLGRLSRGVPPEECVELIEENYKIRMREPYPCRAHYIKSKLHEAEKTGLAEKIRELIPFFKDLAVRDQEKLDLRSVAAAV